MDRKGTQQEQLGSVLGFLKERGTTQKEVAEAIGTDEGTLSSLKSGKVKNVPKEILNALEEKYGINPYYLLGESERMFTCHLKELKHFEQFVKEWDTVERSGEKYLHLFLDKNFYDFLVEVNSIRLAEEEGILTASNQTRNSAHLHAGDPKIQEFVLLPKNNFLEILRTVKEDKKKLDEVIDFIEHINYSESEEAE